MGPVICHNEGGCCLITHRYFDKCLCSAVASPLVVHSMDCAIELAVIISQTKTAWGCKKGALRSEVESLVYSYNW